MAYDIALQRFHELRRLIANDCNITSEGLYAPGELPEDFDGDFSGTVQVVFAVVHVDMSGRISYTTYNPPPLKNKDGEGDLPLEAPIGGQQITIRDGQNTPTITLEWVENENIPDSVRSVGNMSWNTLVENADPDSWRL